MRYLTRYFKPLVPRSNEGPFPCKPQMIISLRKKGCTNRHHWHLVLTKVSSCLTR